MSNRILSILLIVLIALVAFLVLENVMKPTEDLKVVYVEVTPEPTVAIEETPKTSSEPIYVVYVTPEPTEEPHIVYATPEPTKEPNVIYITPEPTEVVTSVPTTATTDTPTQAPIIVVVTEVPTQAPTAVVTAIPTAAPTVEPTMAPTSVPTVEPTVVPTIDVNAFYAAFESEMSTVTMSGGIYPDYTIDQQYDLCNYVGLNNQTGNNNYDLYSYIASNSVDNEKLFDLIRIPFENGIATWTDMEFVDEYSSLNRLSFALESSICDSCGRIAYKHHPENQKEISKLFDEIKQRGECDIANQLLLDYLYEYTVKNPSNPYERLFVVCKH